MQSHTTCLTYDLTRKSTKTFSAQVQFQARRMYGSFGTKASRICIHTLKEMFVHGIDDYREASGLFAF